MVPPVELDSRTRAGFGSQGRTAWMRNRFVDASNYSPRHLKKISACVESSVGVCEAV
jgi:hypothetical protein